MDSVTSLLSPLYTVDTTATGTMPPPASPTDETAGGALAPLLSPAGRGPAKAIIEIESDTGTTLTVVRARLFEFGKWRSIAFAGASRDLFTSLPLLADDPVRFRLNDLGRATRLLIEATSSVASNITVSAQRVDER